MPEADLFAVGLVLAVAVILSRALAACTPVPDAIPQVLLGIGASFVPGMPVIRLSPDIVLLFFLPPLVYHAGFFTAPRETKENAVPIAALAVGLVTATALSVAASARLIVPGLDWAVALALGAAVAPTDPVAATSVMQRLGAPMRVLVVLEGESLVNDGVALTLFGIAVESTGTSVSIGYGVLRFFEEAFGGIAFGLAVGWVIARLRRRVHDPGLQIVVSVITPYVAYIPADRLGASGVLASVGAGVYLGTRAHGLFQPASRMSARLLGGDGLPPRVDALRPARAAAPDDPEGGGRVLGSPARAHRQRGRRGDRYAAAGLGARGLPARHVAAMARP